MNKSSPLISPESYQSTSIITYGHPFILSIKKCFSKYGFVSSPIPFYEKVNSSVAGN